MKFIQQKTHIRIQKIFMKLNQHKSDCLMFFNNEQRSKLSIIPWKSQIEKWRHLWNENEKERKKSDKYEKFHISDYISPHERCGRIRKMVIWEMKLFNKPLMSRQLSHSSRMIYSILCWGRWWKLRKRVGEKGIFFTHMS